MASFFPVQKLVERESCNTKCCKIWINGSKIYFQTKIHIIIAGGTKWGKRGGPEFECLLVCYYPYLHTFLWMSIPFDSILSHFNSHRFGCTAWEPLKLHNCLSSNVGFWKFTIRFCDKWEYHVVLSSSVSSFHWMIVWYCTWDVPKRFPMLCKSLIFKYSNNCIVIKHI
jgi:hypothetical protein